MVDIKIVGIRFKIELLSTSIGVGLSFAVLLLERSNVNYHKISGLRVQLHVSIFLDVHLCAVLNP